MFELLGCNVSVDPQNMSAIVRTESSGNPFAIGIVNHRLTAQPSSKDEAIAIADQLKASGLNYSIGLGQVNQSNFAHYGLDHSNGFDKCANLSAASLILKDCYETHADWEKAYSCYYSGNPVTGFKHGYVDKVLSNKERAVITSISLPKPSSTAIEVRKLEEKEPFNPSPLVELEQLKFNI